MDITVPAPADCVILYFHGDAYAMGSAQAVAGLAQTRAQLELRNPYAGKREKLIRKRGSRYAESGNFQGVLPGLGG